MIQAKDKKRFEDIDQYLLNIDHALQLITDIYDLREVVGRQIDYIKDELNHLKKEKKNETLRTWITPNQDGSEVKKQRIIGN